MLEIQDIPHWFSPNPYVIGGYRRQATPLRALYSLLEWHNETLNIHTHLWPALYFLYATLTVGNEEFYQRSSPGIQRLILCEYSGAAFIGFASAFAHTFYIVSPTWNTVVWKLDYIGILLVNYPHCMFDLFILCRGILGSSLLYTVTSTLFTLFTLTLFTQIVRDYDAALYWGVVYPAITAIPLTLPLAFYSFVIQGHTPIENIVRTLSWESLRITACIIVAGLVFFTGKIPERLWNPGGMLDGVNSHVWHHVCIVCAILCGMQLMPHVYRLEEGLVLKS